MTTNGNHIFRFGHQKLIPGCQPSNHLEKLVLSPDCGDIILSTAVSNVKNVLLNSIKFFNVPGLGCIIVLDAMFLKIILYFIDKDNSGNSRNLVLHFHKVGGEMQQMPRLLAKLLVPSMSQALKNIRSYTSHNA